MSDPKAPVTVWLAEAAVANQAAARARVITITVEPLDVATGTNRLLVMSR